MYLFVFIIVIVIVYITLGRNFLGIWPLLVLTIGVGKLSMPIVEANTLLLVYTKYSLPILYKILGCTIGIDKFVNANCTPQYFFGPWGKNIGAYNFADVNNCIRKKDCYKLPDSTASYVWRYQ